MTNQDRIFNVTFCFLTNQKNSGLAANKLSRMVRPGQAFTSQKLKFTGHLSDDRLLFAGLEGKKKMKNRVDSSIVSVTLEVYEWF